MKNVLLTLLMSLQTIGFVYSQSISDLDMNPRYQKFEIGSAKQSIISEIEYQGTYPDGSEAYLYVGDCCDDIFGYPVASILLRFNEDRLVIIYVETELFQAGEGKFNQWRADDFDKINANFESIFGSPSSKSAENNSGIATAWIGQKVTLLSQYTFLGTYKGDRQDIVLMANDFKP